MSVPGMEQIGDLEIAQDLRFQRRSWAFQRCGWAAMVVLTCVALLGFLGEGPSSDAVARSGDGAYEVIYERYTRHRSPQAFSVVIAEGAVDGGEARVTLDRTYVEGVQIESVVPEPDSVLAAGDQIVYVFKLAEQAVSARLVFKVTYEDVGRKRGKVALDGHPAVSLSQFIYP